MKYLFCLFLVIPGLVQAKTYTLALGNSKVQIIKQEGEGKSFIHLHENESTALAAAKSYIKKEGGSLLTLKHSGKRNVAFYLQKVRYEFDPNRIFSDEGIERSLKKYGSYSLAAHREVKKFADKIKSLLPRGKLIAVHNNRAYSIKEYFPQNTLASDAEALHYQPQTNYRNFYFATRKEEYNRLKKLNFNVALQANNAQNDGSLSYFFAKDNYINIESAYGELNTQIKMLHYA